MLDCYLLFSFITENYKNTTYIYIYTIYLCPKILIFIIITCGIIYIKIKIKKI